jgi:malate/lactate dehydrogenase
MKLKIAIVGAGRIVDWLLTDVKNSKYAKDIQLIGI